MITSIQSSNFTINPAIATLGFPLKDSGHVKLIMAAYMHQIVLDSWKEFRSSVQKHAKQNKEAHQVHGEKRQRIEGARRIIEDTRIRRQASHFRFFEGMDLEVGRHLHVQV